MSRLNADAASDGAAPERAAPAPSGHDAARALVAGLLLLGIALGFWLMLRLSEARFASFVMAGDPGPFALPRICIAIVAIVGAGLTGWATWRILREGAPHLPDLPRIVAAQLMPLAFVATLTSMPIMMRGLGTLPAVALFTVVWSLVLGWRRDGFVSVRLMLEGALVATGAVVLVHTVFVRLLTLPLP